MKIKSIQMASAWTEIDISAANLADQDPGLADVRRVMSGAVRAQIWSSLPALERRFA